MSSYGFNFNSSVVTDEDGKASVGVNFKDSEGFEFNHSEEGAVDEVVDNIAKKFSSAYLANLLESKKQPKVQEAKPTNDMIGRLRKLEQENVELKKIADAQKAKENDTKGQEVEKSAVDSINRATEAMKKRLKADQVSPLKDFFGKDSFDEIFRSFEKHFQASQKAARRLDEDDFWLL